MNVNLVFFKNNLRFLLKIILFCFLSSNAFSAAQLSVRSATPADIGHPTKPSVISSNPAIATATIKGSIVVPGTHTLSVSQLAQAKQVASGYIYPTETNMLGITETLTITTGSVQIIVNAVPTDSLRDIASKINRAATEAHLNAIAYIAATQSNQYQFVIGSTLAGLENAVSVSESPASGNILAISAEITSARDAEFNLDGLSYRTAGNNIVVGEWLQIILNNIGSVTFTVHGA